MKRQTLSVSYDSLFKKRRSYEKPDSCVICTEPLESKQIHLTACGHYFHLSCIRMILNNNCPLCREHISIPRIEDENYGKIVLTRITYTQNEDTEAVPFRVMHRHRASDTVLYVHNDSHTY